MHTNIEGVLAKRAGYNQNNSNRNSMNNNENNLHKAYVVLPYVLVSSGRPPSSRFRGAGTGSKLGPGVQLPGPSGSWRSLVWAGRVKGSMQPFTCVSRVVEIYVCIYIYIYMCIYMYIHIYMCVHVFVYVHAHRSTTWLLSMSFTGSGEGVEQVLYTLLASSLQ